MKKRILLLSAIVISASFSSCNTIAGVGQDVQNLGNSVQSTAIRSSQN